MMAATSHGVVRLIAADDEPVLREAIAYLASYEPRVDLVGLAESAHEAVVLAERFRPDVALVDVRMPGGGGPAAIKGIRACSPGTRILAYSAYDDRTSIIDMIQAGALGYVVKGGDDDPIAAVLRAAGGQRILSDDVLGEVMGELVGRLEAEQRKAQSRDASVARIRSVIEGDGLTIVYQPIVRLDDHGIAGFEALSRFSTTPVRPDLWFAEAADVELLFELECAAIERALEGSAQIPGSAYLSVNVSPTTVTDPAFAARSAAWPLEHMVLEITEHAEVTDYRELQAALGELKARQAKIAVDDAGAGFASLQHIVNMTPGLIKLDLSLVRGIDADASRRALTAGLVRFAHETGASLVAEGIETAEELATLRALGVNHGQGYYLGRPGDLAGHVARAETRDAIRRTFVHQAGLEPATF